MPPWPTAKRRPSLAEWETVYHQWAPRGVRYAVGLLGSHADAEEAVQEAFCRLWQSRQWDGDIGGLGPLFLTTVRNFAIDLLRRRGRRRAISIVDAGEPIDRRSDDPAQLSPDVVFQLMEELPATWRDALRLRIDAELSYREIAQVLGCTTGQVRTWILSCSAAAGRTTSRAGLAR